MEVMAERTFFLYKLVALITFTFCFFLIMLYLLLFFVMFGESWVLVFIKKIE